MPEKHAKIYICDNKFEQLFISPNEYPQKWISSMYSLGLSQILALILLTTSESKLDYYQ